MKKKLLLSIFTIFLCFGIYAQTITLKGKVIDGTTNEPLPGVNVAIKGTTKGTITDVNGNFSLSVAKKPGITLLFSSIGYATYSQIAGEATNFNISMTEDAIGLDDLVVTGVGTLTAKKRLGNAISTVSEKAISKSNAISLDAALSGKLAGSHITQNSGGASGGVSIRLRGASTVLGSSDPLYIIDGVIVNNSSNTLVALGGASQNRLIDIEPQDIEKIEVIKGAAAAAIYGSRASNGVIQIWTKRGRTEKISINYLNSFGVSSIRKKLPTNDVKKVWLQNADGSYTAVDTNPDGSSVERYDYQDGIYQSAFNMKHYLSLSGGTENSAYFFSVSNLLNNGIVKNTDFNRTTARLRIDYTPFDWLNLSVGSNYSFNESSDMMGNGDFSASILASHLFIDNTTDPRPVDGVYPSIGWTPNPLEAIDKVDIKQTTSRSISDFKLILKPIENLKIDYTLGFDYAASIGTKFFPVGYNNRTGTSNRKNINELKINHDLNIVYLRDLTEDIQSTTSLGASLQYDKFESISIQATDLLVGTNTTNSGGSKTTDDYLSERTISGTYIQQTFGFWDKLFLTGAIRLDRSSAFADSEIFPKLSFSYILSDEDFWKTTFGSKFNTMKIRACWGEAGNLTAITPYQRYTNYTTVNIDGSTGLVPPSDLGSKDVKPERQKEFEFGLDMGFLSGRLGVEMTYYKQDITDLLLERTLSPSTGASRRLENVGNMTNKGFELLVRATPIKKQDFTWAVTGTYSTNKNKVDGIEGDIITYAWGESAAKNGYPLGVFYTTYYARNTDGSYLLTSAGLPQREKGHYENYIPVSERDASGQPTGSNLKKVTGDPNPDFIFSLINEFSYKNFSLRFQFDGTQGGDIIAWDKRMLNRFGEGNGKELNGERPRGWGAAEFNIWESFIEDGSFIKLRELSLSYNYKPPVNWCNNILITLSGRNLFSIDNYYGMDPEISREGQSNVVRGNDMAGIPIPRTFLFGLNVQF